MEELLSFLENNSEAEKLICKLDDLLYRNNIQGSMSDIIEYYSSETSRKQMRIQPLLINGKTNGIGLYYESEDGEFKLDTAYLENPNCIYRLMELAATGYKLKQSSEWHRENITI